MFEIKGRLNTALCYASVFEEEAVEQIRRMCDYPSVEGCRIRIMPDVHAGTGCTVGTTMTITDRAVPNVVGVDIGCGMYTVRLKETGLDFPKIDEAAHFIPSGKNVWEEPVEEFDLERLYCYKELRNLNWLRCSLGTLGGGNHFIEIDVSSEGVPYLVIHSGSRNLGVQVAGYYQQKAIELQLGIPDYLAEREKTIRTLKEQGRDREIEKALKALKEKRDFGEPPVPRDLCYLTGEALQDYLHDIEICQEFARRNREKMAEVLLSRTGLEAEEAFHTIHNYIDTEEMILRKGAIAAHEGEKVLIPINMRDGSILATGKGNPEWNYSAPHGAGRVLSRTAARNRLNLEEYADQMKGVYTTSVTEGTLDEAPMAYKSLEDILPVIGETVTVHEVLKPVYNFKAND